MVSINPELQFNAWDKDLFFHVKTSNSCSFLLLHNLAVHIFGIWSVTDLHICYQMSCKS